MFLNTSVWVVGNAVGVYYFKYVLENESLYSVSEMDVPTNLLGLILTPILTKKFGKKALSCLEVQSLLSDILRAFCSLDNLGLFIGISMVYYHDVLFDHPVGMVQIQLSMVIGKQEYAQKRFPLGSFHSR